jgi:hypothetical protein
MVSGFEDYIRRCLEIVFEVRPESLKSPKTFTYEDILNCKDMKNLKDVMIAEEVNFALRDGIDGLHKYLKTRNLGPDLSHYSDWIDFRELFYRRNIVVHNNCYPDQDYSKKTGFNDMSVRMSIDEPYLAKGLDLFANS